MGGGAKILAASSMRSNCFDCWEAAIGPVPRVLKAALEAVFFLGLTHLFPLGCTGAWDVL